ncbi:MAG: hypothetical protein KKB25_03175 [Nanoarchaeota archaeon]|nr:hypothetical protein [Nanoarchaeota archaeon]
MFNPFKKKQNVREEQQQEQYFPPELERFKVREEEIAPPITLFDMPEKERKFKAFAREMENPENIGMGFGERAGNAPAKRSAAENKPVGDADRLDMVLQKLETIDLRLKLIEQKLERRPI